MIRKLLLPAICLILMAGSASAAARLPEVVILATGGTIAGSHADRSATVGYKPAALPVNSLIDAVPELRNVADVRGEQVFQIASENMDFPQWFTLAEAVRKEVARRNVAGVVITHGTDTLEETAWFLNLTVNTDKPIVLVGAMRPATAMSADGPLNLLDAVTVAASPQARGMGVLVVMNGSIFGARDVRKGHTVRPDAFRGGDLGMLGHVIGGKTTFLLKSLRRHTASSEFARMRGDGDIPRVDIIYGYGGTPTAMLESGAVGGAKGFVVACTGDGSLSTALRPSVRKLVEGGVPVVRATRIADGPVVRNGEVNDDEFGTIPAGTISPQKARILLVLALMRKMRPEEIARLFDIY